MTGTRRNRAIEHTHLFLDVPELPPDDPSNFFWLYGAFDFKMQCPMEQAQATVFRTIDKLVERMNRLGLSRIGGAPSTTTVGGGGGAGGTATGGYTSKASGPTASGTPTVPGLNYGVGTDSNKASPAVPPFKAHLIFDIISTKKHLGPVPTEGLPYQLGLMVYDYVERTHNIQIVTTFVGLTDNTARRVGRDVYYTQSDALSKNRMPFTAIDKVHMFVVFPPDHPEEGGSTVGKAKGEGRPKSSGAQVLKTGVSGSVPQKRPTSPPKSNARRPGSSPRR
jgi:hypothetical protein